MNLRVLRLAFIAVLLLAFGAIAAACDGGGEPLTIEEYFGVLELLSDDLNERSDALDEQYADDFAAAESEEDAIKLFQEFYTCGLPDLLHGSHETSYSTVQREAELRKLTLSESAHPCEGYCVACSSHVHW